MQAALGAATVILAVVVSGCTVTVGPAKSPDESAAAVLGDGRFEVDAGTAPTRADLHLAPGDSIRVLSNPNAETFELVLTVRGQTMHREGKYLNVLCTDSGQSLEIDTPITLTPQQITDDLRDTQRLGVPEASIDKALRQIDDFEKAGGGMEDLHAGGNVKGSGGEATFGVGAHISNDLGGRRITYVLSWPQSCR